MLSSGTVVPFNDAVNFAAWSLGAMLFVTPLGGCTSKSSSKNNSAGGADGGQDASPGGASGSAGTSGSGGASGSSGASGNSGASGSSGAGGTALVLAPKSVALGAEHGCAVHPNSGVVCWGDNAFGNLGRGFISGAEAGATFELDSAPVLMTTAGPALGNATRVAAGLGHTCALTGPDMYCWGRNLSKELGANAGNVDSSSLPVLVSANDKVVDLAAGDQHSCAALEKAGIKCWGDSSEFQLGPAGVPLSTKKIFAIEAGGNVSCAITDGAPRELYCWGSNQFSQLTSKESAPKSINPVKIDAVSDPTKVAVGTTHVCAIDGSGALWCWGKNFEGQVGNNTGGNGQIVKDPVMVVGAVQGTTALDVEAGFNQTCALVDAGQPLPAVYCWGGNVKAQLVKGGLAANTLPLLVSGLASGGSPVVEIATLGNMTGCARNAVDEIYCWGANASGQTGSGAASEKVNGPTLVPKFP